MSKAPSASASTWAAGAVASSPALDVPAAVAVVAADSVSAGPWASRVIVEGSTSAEGLLTDTAAGVGRCGVRSYCGWSEGQVGQPLRPVRGCDEICARQDRIGQGPTTVSHRGRAARGARG